MKRKTRVKHGKTGTKIYAVWRGLKYRCNNKSGKDYSRYGGRGIKVQLNWLDDFCKFYSYVKTLNGYSDSNVGEQGLSLDRINNEGNYEEGNLRWASRTTQSRNRRMFKNNKCGFIGVSLEKGRGTYRARIKIGGKYLSLGSKKTAKEAYQLRLNYIKTNNLKGFKTN